MQLCASVTRLCRVLHRVKWSQYLHATQHQSTFLVGTVLAEFRRPNLWLPSIDAVAIPEIWMVAAMVNLAFHIDWSAERCFDKQQARGYDVGAQAADQDTYRFFGIQGPVKSVSLWSRAHLLHMHHSPGH